MKVELENIFCETRKYSAKLFYKFKFKLEKFIFPELDMWLNSKFLSLMKLKFDEM